MPRFLLELAKVPNVAGACRKAGVGRATAYRYRDDDEVFAAGWDQAINCALDDLEGATYARAVKQSDTLAIFLLKSHRPAVYGDRSRQDITLNGRLAITADDVLDALQGLGK